MMNSHFIVIGTKTLGCSILQALVLANMEEGMLIMADPNHKGEPQRGLNILDRPRPIEIPILPFEACEYEPLYLYSEPPRDYAPHKSNLTARPGVRPKKFYKARSNC